MMQESAKFQNKNKHITKFTKTRRKKMQAGFFMPIPIHYKIRGQLLFIENAFQDIATTLK